MSTPINHCAEWRCVQPKVCCRFQACSSKPQAKPSASRSHGWAEEQGFTTAGLTASSGNASVAGTSINAGAATSQSSSMADQTFLPTSNKSHSAVVHCIILQYYMEISRFLARLVELWTCQRLYIVIQSIVSQN